MPIKLEYTVSRQQFEAALSLARSDRVLSEEWLERSRRVRTARSRSFMAMLGTALLAKASNDEIDPFAL